jgi:flagellar basal body rod protein FlgB
MPNSLFSDQESKQMPINNTTPVDAVASALSVAGLRHQVIASNIANREAAGYQRLAVRFSQALGSAGEPRVEPENTVAIDGRRAAAASLEEDMVALSSNAMSYQALARALAKYFSIAETIASGGRV